MEWTEEEISQFDALIDKQSSHDQVTRISGRLDMKVFIELHGKDKCDAMWKHLESGGSVEASKETNVE